MSSFFKSSGHTQQVWKDSSLGIRSGSELGLSEISQQVPNFNSDFRSYPKALAVPGVQRCIQSFSDATAQARIPHLIDAFDDGVEQVVSVSLKGTDFTDHHVAVAS